MEWRICARPCARPSRRARSCRSHHSRLRHARRSDGGYRNTSSPFSNRSRPLSTCGKTGHYFNGDSDATSIAVNLNYFRLSDLVLCSKTQTALFRATLLIQTFFNFCYTKLHFTLLYFD